MNSVYSGARRDLVFVCMCVTVRTVTPVTGVTVLKTSMARACDFIMVSRSIVWSHTFLIGSFVQSVTCNCPIGDNVASLLCDLTKWFTSMY